MAAIDQEIIDKVAGDEIPIERTYEALPTGLVLSKAWITVKKHKTDTDANAKIGPKSITTTLTADGQITDASTTSDLKVALNFILSPSETALLTPLSKYFYDIQVRTATGGPYTLELGTILLQHGITDAAV